MYLAGFLRSAGNSPALPVGTGAFRGAAWIRALRPLSERPHLPHCSGPAPATPDGGHGLRAAGREHTFCPMALTVGGQVPSVRMAATRRQLGSERRKAADGHRRVYGPQGDPARGSPCC